LTPSSELRQNAQEQQDHNDERDNDHDCHDDQHYCDDASETMAAGTLRLRRLTPSHRTPTIAPRHSLRAEHDVEGIVAKRTDSPYRPGERSSDWLKLKTADWREMHAPRRYEQ
jgi:ATP dependent DNA ligase domain